MQGTVVMCKKVKDKSELVLLEHSDVLEVEWWTRDKQRER